MRKTIAAFMAGGVLAAGLFAGCENKAPEQPEQKTEQKAEQKPADTKKPARRPVLGC